MKMNIASVTFRIIARESVYLLAYQPICLFLSISANIRAHVSFVRIYVCREKLGSLAALLNGSAEVENSVKV